MEQPIVRLNFTCNRNWEDMLPIKDGRFCNDCQKKVVDFTGKTNDEIAVYLMSSTTQVCGRFQNSQLAPAPLSKPTWKRWLSAAAMFAVFMGIKEASAQTNNVQDTSKNVQQSSNKNYALGGEIVLVSYNHKAATPTQKVYAFNEVDEIPSFPAGEKAFATYLRKNIPAAASANANGIASFVVDKFGNIINVSIMKSANAAADAEAIKAFQNSPKWKPGTKNAEAVAVKLVLPFSFTEKIMKNHKD
ncbi:MAG: hypothetical protein EOP42_24780 [Sphingobacteriaceae bacterium]|nr:MAG: hypothetical protein EOP42_24780 [Sphingobacteriaceae bacterium]